MSCASGLCGIRNTGNAAAAVARPRSDGHCCQDCADEENYREMMRGMLNPWMRNAGANPDPSSPDGYYSGSDPTAPKTGPLPGTRTQNSDAGAYGLASAAISEIGATARAQMAADAARAAAQSATDAARANAANRYANNGTMPNSTNQNLVAGAGTGSQPSSNNSMFILAGLAAAAILLSGKVRKL